jgi:hypothetical protein
LREKTSGVGRSRAVNIGTNRHSCCLTEVRNRGKQARQRLPPLISNQPIREVGVTQYKIRDCRLCGKSFQPTGGWGWHCSWQCRFKGLFLSIKPEKSGCMNFPLRPLANGYCRISYEGGSIKAHRASWIVHKGEIPNGLFVCHKCDNTVCVNPDHLFLGTAADNNKDKSAKGRSCAPSGSLQWRSKLSDSAVLEILMDTRLQREIAVHYGINQSVVSEIKRGKAWKHVTCSAERQSLLRSRCNSA